MLFWSEIVMDVGTAVSASAVADIEGVLVFALLVVVLVGSVSPFLGSLEVSAVEVNVVGKADVMRALDVSRLRCTSRMEPLTTVGWVIVGAGDVDGDDEAIGVEVTTIVVGAVMDDAIVVCGSGLGVGLGVGSWVSFKLSLPSSPLPLLFTFPVLSESEFESEFALNFGPPLLLPLPLLPLLPSSDDEPRRSSPLPPASLFFMRSNSCPLLKSSVWPCPFGCIGGITVFILCKMLADPSRRPPEC